jgi:hypothetical protein
MLSIFPDVKYNDSHPQPGYERPSGKTRAGFPGCLLADLEQTIIILLPVDINEITDSTAKRLLPL